jgi:hypothetical protein
LPNLWRGTNPNMSYQVSNESWLQKQNGKLAENSTIKINSHFHLLLLFSWHPNLMPLMTKFANSLNLSSQKIKLNHADIKPI